MARKKAKNHTFTRDEKEKMWKDMAKKFIVEFEEDQCQKFPNLHKLVSGAKEDDYNLFYHLALREGKKMFKDGVGHVVENNDTDDWMSDEMNWEVGVGSLMDTLFDLGMWIYEDEEENI